jgi:hypothetical protein
MTSGSPAASAGAEIIPSKAIAPAIIAAKRARLETGGAENIGPVRANGIGIVM